MKAYVLHEINRISYEEVPMPTPKDDEVLVKVKAAGVCGSDIPRIFTKGTYHYPLIPGHEFSGEVVDTKERVGVFPLIPCGKCEMCRKGKYEMCRDYDYIGSRSDGAFSEYVCVPRKNLITIPDSVSYEEAAMLEPMAVAVHAIKRIAPKKGETVAVCGLGTIGMLVIEFLLDMGIEDIIVFANKEYQRQKALELGIKKENLGLKNRPIDVFFECVGSNETINWALNLTAPEGRIMLVGNPKSDMELSQDIYWKILRKQLTLVGTWNSSFSMDGFQIFGKPDDWHYALERVVNGGVEPKKLITHKFRMEELDRGFALMRDKSEEYIKVMGIADDE